MSWIRICSFESTSLLACDDLSDTNVGLSRASIFVLSTSLLMIWADFFSLFSSDLVAIAERVSTKILIKSTCSTLLCLSQTWSVLAKQYIG